MKTILRRVVTASVLLVISVVVMLGCVGALQQQLIFFPDSLDEHQDLSWTGGREVFVEADDGARIHGLFFDAGDDARGVVLYLHGNAGSVASWYEVAQRLTRHRVDVFLIDYRTYGKSSGEMSERGLYLDGQAGYDHLIEIGYAPDSIIVHGRSLGSAVATHLAADHPMAGLVLETPFTDLPALASDLYPVPLPRGLFQYELDNLDRADGIDIPTWVVHGTDDEIVPVDHGKKVYEHLAQPWKITLIEQGRHNNLMTFRKYGRELDSFYEHVLGDGHTGDPD